MRLNSVRIVLLQLEKIPFGWLILITYFNVCHAACTQSILRTLKDRVAERESKPSAEQQQEKNAWEYFWKLTGPELLLYACSYGSVDSVIFLISMGCLENCER